MNIISRLKQFFWLSMLLMVTQSAALARVLVAQGAANPGPGEMMMLHIEASAPKPNGAGMSVEILDRVGNIIVADGQAVSGPTTLDVHVPCGVDQPSMNATSYKIWNETPGLNVLTASASTSGMSDGEVAANSGGGGVTPNNAGEAGGGTTLFGALASVNGDNPEDGKYWDIHLEKDERMRVDGWAVSDTETYGAAIVIEVQNRDTGDWDTILAAAPYGFASFEGGGFVAPVASSYKMRVRCTAHRLCKFAVSVTTTRGRQIAPPYSDTDCKDCGTSNLPVELSQGREQSEFGSDISVANPVGPDVDFGRQWREVLALQRAGTPGLARGWTHSYDIRLTSVGKYDLQIQYSSGAQENWTAELDTDGNPTGKLNPPTGAPYRVQGVVNPLDANPDDPKDPVTKKWSSLELTWDDSSKWSFVPSPARYSYQLDRQINATGQYLQFAYDTGTNDGALQTISNQNGTTLLTLNYVGAFLANVTDIYGRRVAYSWEQPAGSPKVVLTGVSTIYAASSTASPPTYQQYQYWLYAAEANKPLLQTIITRSPNGGNGVTTAYNNYDNDARVASTTDGNGNVHQYTYLSDQTFVAIKNMSGQVIQVWTRYYDAQGRDTGHADASLNRWTMYYDDGNNPLKATRMVDPMGRTATTTYDAFGHVTSVTSSRGVRQIATWDYSNWSLGRLVQTQTQGSDGTFYTPTTYSYFEPSGLIQSVVARHPEQGGAGGGLVSSQFTYDSYGNPLTATEPGENTATRTTTFNYTQDGTYSQPMFVGRPLRVTDALGNTSRFRYDARGNATSNIDGANVTTNTDYDLADAAILVTYAASGQTGSGRGRTDFTYSYIGGPLRTSTTRDEAGAVVNTLSQTYGNEGELVTQSGDQTSQSVTYDALYRAISFQDGNGSATNYFYDGNGRATGTVYPGADPTTGANMERTTAFDPSGLPLQSIDGRGVVSNFGYTPDGLPASVNYPASPAENVSLSYNSFGQPTGRADASGEEIYAYNNRGLMTTQSTRYRDAAGALMNPFVQTQHFYASGALQQLATSLGNQDYGYDAAGRLTGMQDPDGALTGWSYDARDQLQSQTLSTLIAGNITTTLTRNVLGQLTSQRHAGGNNVTLSSWGHPSDATQKQLYNALGQLTRNMASTTPTYNWGGTTNYAYDSREQLASESSTRGATYTQNVGYNGAANPVSWKGTTRSFNNRNQETTGNKFLYDGAGNTTKMPNGNLAAPGVAAPTQKLVYNAQGQLAELRDVAGVLIATYVYRGDGKRAWKQLANGQRSYFYYAGETLIASTNGVDVSSLQLWGADGLVGARTTNSATNVTTKSYNLYDTQGNLAQTVNARNGNLLSKSAVNAWGEPIRDSAGNVAGAGYGAKFGYIRDGESGFYLCTLRYYDASAGRWLTRDPIGYAGGSNLYGYVGNDPVNAADPLGLSAWDFARGAVKGVVAVGLGIVVVSGVAMVSLPAATVVAVAGAALGGWAIGTSIYEQWTKMEPYTWRPLSGAELDEGAGQATVGALTLAAGLKFSAPKSGEIACLARTAGNGKALPRTRLAPFGNRPIAPKGGKITTKPWDDANQFPHYHSVRFDNAKGKFSGIPGTKQGIGRHRPIDKFPSDKSWKSRF